MARPYSQLNHGFPGRGGALASRRPAAVPEGASRSGKVQGRPGRPVWLIELKDVAGVYLQSRMGRDSFIFTRSFYKACWLPSLDEAIAMSETLGIGSVLRFVEMNSQQPPLQKKEV